MEYDAVDRRTLVGRRKKKKSDVNPIITPPLDASALNRMAIARRQYASGENRRVRKRGKPYLPKSVFWYRKRQKKYSITKNSITKNLSFSPFQCPTFPSPPLLEFPDTVLILTNRNYAGVCTKLTESLNENGINAIFSDGTKVIPKQDVTKTLAIIYEPGNTGIETFGLNLPIPKKMPWGILRGSSYYRIENIRLQLVQHPNSHFDIVNLEKINKFFDGLTPLIMCGTECLMDINPYSVFLGQPQRFGFYDENKKPHSIGHVASPSLSDINKGTNLIADAFNKIDFMPSDIIGIEKVPHECCMDFMRKKGMMVSTMTEWNSGIGYTTLEAASCGCLVMSRKPEQASYIDSMVVDVRTPSDIISKAKYYFENDAEYQVDRKNQYTWFERHFSYEGIARRFRAIVQDFINTEWKRIPRPYLRRL